MRPSYLIPLVAVLPALAQPPLVTFGVQGGVPVQTPLGGTNNKMPFVLGPTLDFHLFSGLSLETGVLFHRMGIRTTGGVFTYPENSVTLSYGTQRGNAIEIPILAKYHFLFDRKNLRPFVTAGPSIRRTSIEYNYTSSILSGTSLGSIGTQSPFRNFTGTRWNVDPTVGVGLDFKASRFHLEPEARYSYWGAGSNTLVRKNQVDFLLGFRF